MGVFHVFKIVQMVQNRATHHLRSLKLITNNYHNDYKFLLNETGNSTMDIKRLRTLALEIFKTSNNLNPNFMKDIFNFSPYSTHRKHDIFVHS